jgi:hypothetical protein
MNRRDMAKNAVIAALGAAFLLFLSGARAAGVALPKVTGPLLQTDTKGLNVWNVAATGYVAAEYFISGRSDVYAPVAMSDAADMSTRNHQQDLSRREFALKTLKENEPYTTRLVVYRPADAGKFSGNVIVELFHPQGGGTGLTWGDLNYFFINNGDAYVGVQHPGTFAGLQSVDAARYAPLQSVDNTQLWAMLAQAGALAKSNAPTSPLAGYAVRHLFMTGISFTGVATSTFANYHHRDAKLADGRNIFDGYLSVENATYDRPLDVPMIHLNTQGEYNSFNGIANRRPDGDEPGNQYRRYEIAGLPHVTVRRDRPLPTAIRPEPLPVPGANSPLRSTADVCQERFPKNSQPSDFPGFVFSAAAFRNLYEWVENGTPPPKGAPLEAGANGTTILDANGNARGGVRSPYVDLPVATYGVGSDDCLLYGYRSLFDAAKNRSLYTDRDEYVRQVRVSVAQLVKRRWILASDAPFIVKEAQAVAAF